MRLNQRAAQFKLCNCAFYTYCFLRVVFHDCPPPHFLMLRKVWYQAVRTQPSTAGGPKEYHQRSQNPPAAPSHKRLTKSKVQGDRFDEERGSGMSAQSRGGFGSIGRNVKTPLLVATRVCYCVLERRRLLWEVCKTSPKRPLGAECGVKWRQGPSDL
jgi:hypothetical protein